MTWIIVFTVLVVIIAAVWIGNTIRWTRQNNMLARKSPRLFDPGHEDQRRRNR
ncbi:hypothetical protein [uncultured Modestobacter sp.]|uniref:hypothetical protein n=1 Tax=uncultured Modestobacter sp. TaxID=380048 RepID=UPI00260D972D|nr:hypothetical protein [uncultured Modestobacter sp.]